MKMVEIQAGLGLGVKKFRLVWVFEKEADLNAFVNSGWELGAQTTAAAKAAGKGEAFAGATSIKPGVWLYQLTDDGLALELTAKGTKYYKDSDLNGTTLRRIRRAVLAVCAGVGAGRSEAP
jgi:lipid-binding SYLF domain-containing protein